MKITKDEILHVAHLARLEIDDGEIDKFAGQIGTILSYVDTLNTVNTEGIKPTSHAINLTNAFRKEGNVNTSDRDGSLSNAPMKEDGTFVVPKVIS